MSFAIFQPASIQEAMDLLSGSPLPFDSPTQHRFRVLEHLENTFGAGRRRPEWVWAARDDGGNVAAIVAGLSKNPGIVLDHFGVRDAAALPAVLQTASEAARQLPEPVASLFAPAGLGARSPQVQPWTTALEGAGWQLLVERYHYEFTPDGDLAADVATSLR